MMNLPKPFLGRLLLETIEDDAEEFLRNKLEKDTGVNLKESLIQVVFGEDDYDPLTGQKKFKVYDNHKKKMPHKKGKIIDLAQDAFGECYMRKYGSDAPKAGLGDIVYFIPGQAFKVDWDEKYCMIADEDVIAIEEKTNKDNKEATQ